MYGTMSFIEMVAVGASVMMIQDNMPEIPDNSTIKIEYFQSVLAFGCGGTSVIALLFTVILWPMTIGQR